jgi:hypothetical protein
MNNQSEIETLERLADSLRNLIKVLIQLFPEGSGEEFDEEAYLTILGKAEQDAAALQFLLERVSR